MSSPSALIGAPPDLSQAPANQPQTDDNQWRGQYHPHGQAAAEVFKARIRVAIEFTKNARKAVEDAEGARKEAGSAQGAKARADRQNDESRQSLEQRLVNLAGMAGQSVRTGEDDRPRNVGRTSPEFRLDEIGDAHEENADRRDQADKVEHGQRRRVVAPGEQQDSNRRADQAAVESHPAFPDFEDFDRVRKIIGGVVKQHVAQAPAYDDAERAIDQEIVDAGRAWARGPPPQGIGDEDAPNQNPAEKEARDIRQPIPTNGERTQLNEDRIDRRKGQGKERHRFGGDALMRPLTSRPHAAGALRSRRFRLSAANRFGCGALHRCDPPRFALNA